MESLSELGAPVVHQTNKLKSDTQIFFSSGQYCRPTICWQNAIITISCNKIVSFFFVAHINLAHINLFPDGALVKNPICGVMDM